MSCYHNYPYVDENPDYYDYINLGDRQPLNGRFQFKCKHCGREYICNIFTQEGKIFNEKYNAKRSDCPY